MDARVRHLVDAVTRGLGTDELLRALQTEGDRKQTLVAELAGLDDLTRVVSVDARQLALDLAAIAVDVKKVLAKHIRPARQMIRQLLEGRIHCEPFEEADGARGYRFRATGTYGRLLPAQLRCNDGGGSNGIRTRVRVAITQGHVPSNDEMKGEWLIDLEETGD